MIRTLLVMCFLLSCLTLKGQNLFNLSSQSFSGINRVGRDYDGGYIFGGSYLMKMDSAANVKWVKYLSGYFSTSHIDDFVTTNDSGLVIASSTQDSIFLMKLDTTPAVVWSRSCVFFAIQANITSIHRASGNSLLVSGDYYDYNQTSHLFVLKIDSMGGTMWCKEYRIGNHINSSFSLIELPDSSIMISAMAADSGSNFKATLMKVNKGGTPIWAKSIFSVSPSSIAFSLLQDSSGIFGIISDQDSTKIFDLDSSGNSSWGRKISASHTRGKNLKHLTNGRFVFSGIVNLGTTGLYFMDSSGNVNMTIMNGYNIVDIPDYIQIGDGFLVITSGINYGIQKLDSLGNGICTLSASLSSNPITISFQIDVVTDSTISGTTPTTRYLFDTNELFDSTCDLQFWGIKELNRNEDVIVFPNPSNDKFNIKSTTGEFVKSTITIYNSIGEIIFSGSIENISSVELKPGVYELSVLSPNGHFAHKKLIRL